MAATWAEEDYARREREQEEWLKSRPVCDECGEPIQDEGYYKFEGDIYCEECWHTFCVREFFERIE